MTPTTSSSLDPRSIVTPDAFELSPSLLGRPLAGPWRRFWALMIDLVVIGVITVVTKSFALVLGVVAAILFIRASFKRTEVRGSVFGRAMRLSLGCLGLFIGVITAVIWAAVGFGGSVEQALRDDLRVESSVDGSGAVNMSLAGVLGGLSDVGEFRSADTAEEAEAAATQFARLLLDAGVPARDIEGVLLEATPSGADWADEAPELVGRAVERAGRGGSSPAGEGATPVDESASPAASLTVAEAMAEYADLVGSGATSAEALARMAVLRDRLRAEVAGDTLAALEERVGDLQQLAQRRETELRRVREALEEAEEGGGFFAWLRTIVDELGFGFGWASLYLTVILSWWKGLTVGKKLLGIRVVRLDGEPITWWVAFERAGGYAAGFATGLLGFAQVFWDANRQCIHDRIVGTVVVVDGAEPVGDWEKAL